MANRWSEEEVESFSEFIGGETDVPPVTDRTNEAVTKKLAELISDVRAYFSDTAMRHAASQPVLEFVSDRKASSDGGHKAYCEDTVARAFFVGGFNTDSMAAKCRKAAFDHLNTKAAA